MSHQLQSYWTLYFQNSNNTDANDYASSIHKIGKFNTVEDFWSFYSHIKRPNQISENVDIHLFRNDICGMWEDEENRNGGKWTIFLKKDVSSLIWEKTLLSLIGELFPDDILGVIIAIREETDILSFWTRQSRSPQNDPILINIAETISRVLELPNTAQFKFKPHFETKTATKTSLLTWRANDSNIQNNTRARDNRQQLNNKDRPKT